MSWNDQLFDVPPADRRLIRTALLALLGASRGEELPPLSDQERARARSILSDLDTLIADDEAAEARNAAIARRGGRAPS